MYIYHLAQIQGWSGIKRILSERIRRKEALLEFEYINIFFQFVKGLGLLYKYNTEDHTEISWIISNQVDYLVLELKIFLHESSTRQHKSV